MLIVVVDEPSLLSLGRWPRGLHAQLIGRLSDPDPGARPDGLRWREVDLVQVAMNAYENVGAQAQARGVALNLDYDIDEAWVQGDADLLERVFVNRLDNALKYSDEGGEFFIVLSERDEDEALPLSHD
jgi:signal transduction histidine kinase